jgi:voltage-dependent calcium channel
MAASIVHPVPSTSATHLSRKGTLLHRFRNFYDNVTRPFALSSGTSAGYPVSSSSMGGATTPGAASSVTLVGPVPSNRKRADTTATLLEKPSSSPPSSTSRQQQQQQQQQEKEVLFLPFQFSVNLARRVTRRNLPYLRHSWTRTDAVSVAAFWITFVLAQTGVEHSAARHIGVFRALSVLRAARLLSITSGTTVGDYDICTFLGWTSPLSP